LATDELEVEFRPAADRRRRVPAEVREPRAQRQELKPGWRGQRTDLEEPHPGPLEPAPEKPAQQTGPEEPLEPAPERPAQRTDLEEPLEPAPEKPAQRTDLEELQGRRPQLVGVAGHAARVAGSQASRLAICISKPKTAQG
jgi:hypothetical protein